MTAPHRAPPPPDAPAHAASLARIDALQRALGAERRETALSWLLLTPERVLKFRKPVRLGFVDFASATARRRDCRTELRLNRALAPSLYLGVRALTGPADAPQLGADQPGAVDYAVEMRRFPDGALLVEQLAAGTLQRAHLQDLAQRLAAFHAAAPRAAPDAPHGTPAAVAGAFADVLDGLARCGTDVAGWRDWLRTQAAALTPHWQVRHDQGAIRECHGDLHLANAVLLPDAAGTVHTTAFDRLEFNPALRWTDPVHDIAFLMMDLQAHGRRDLAWAFLDAWLQASGDFAALPSLRFARVYRALVRALVVALRALQGAPSPAPAANPPDYAALAHTLAQPAWPRLLITHGLSGSGKTWATQALLERWGAVRLRSDVERKRLFGLTALQRSADAVPGGIYGPEATARTFARLAEGARLSLQAGWPTVVDAAFLKRAERDRFAALAAECGVPFAILPCHADPAVLAQRVLARQGRGDDASEADLAVLQRQQDWLEPLGADEPVAPAALAEPVTDLPL
jgi:uncharacterized protein